MTRPSPSPTCAHPPPIPHAAAHAGPSPRPPRPRDPSHAIRPTRRLGLPRAASIEEVGSSLSLTLTLTRQVGNLFDWIIIIVNGYIGLDTMRTIYRFPDLEVDAAPHAFLSAGYTINYTMQRSMSWSGVLLFLVVMRWLKFIPQVGMASVAATAATAVTVVTVLRVKAVTNGRGNARHRAAVLLFSPWLSLVATGRYPPLPPPCCRSSRRGSTLWR